MYTGHGFNDWGIGDVDVFKVGDTYHLFHLVLPNHAYIAHATSTDGLNWTRVPNAVFVGDPGAWDDDMLWTMHVSPDPQKQGRWRMFYTGLCRKESGRIQRNGLAVSDDLYTWRKVEDGGWPMTIQGPHYEATLDEGRHWVSFRDPFYRRVGEEGWLLAAARVPSGPVNRRGCVFLAKEKAPGRFETQAPLATLHQYDDVEVPMLISVGGRWYLIASIREDIKVHYWQAERPEGPYSNYADNVLLPAGNYAARVCDEGDALTVWNFFYVASRIKGTGNMLPPPKELTADADGQLRLRSYRGFDRMVTREHAIDELAALRAQSGNPRAAVSRHDMACRFGCDTAFEIFRLPGTYRNFRLRGTLEKEGQGKCGLVLRLNDDSDGYFISLELIKGLAQIRAWGNNPGGGIEEAFIYRPLQANYFVPDGLRPHGFELIAFGDYIELSIDGDVLLSLADDTFREGAVGFYTESTYLRVDGMTLEELRPVEGETWGGTDEPPWT
jgi:beta-fructofuranosidase